MPTALTAGRSHNSLSACGPDAPAPFLDRMSRAVLRKVTLLETWSERAHQRRALRGLSDHQMQDLALSKADIEAEAAKSFWQA